MNFEKFKKCMEKISKKVKKQSPAILTGTAVLGLITTAVAAFKAAPKANDILEKHKIRMETAKKEEKLKIRMETAKKLVPVLAKPVVLGTITIACIICSNTISSRRIATLSAAYSISETALNELNGKMTDILGEKKARSIKDAIVKDKVNKQDPPKESNIIITGDGDVLCQDMYSGRYFRSNAEKIGQAINWASAEVRNCMYVSLNEFYEKIGIPYIPLGDEIGWNVDDLNGGTLPITYTAVLTEDNRPCLCVAYNACLRTNFKELY